MSDLFRCSRGPENNTMYPYVLLSMVGLHMELLAFRSSSFPASRRRYHETQGVQW